MNKILCVCRFGSVRSTAMAHVLKTKGHEAIAIGHDTTTEETKQKMMDWADTVFIAEGYMQDKLPTPRQGQQIIDVEVGPDVWGLDGMGSLMYEIRPMLDTALAKMYTGNILNK